MPNCDGIEVLMSIRREQPSIRVLAISSGGRVGPGDYLNTARVLGADGVMVKPLRLETFRRTVEAMLAAPRTPRGSAAEAAG
nr:response regulator [Brevundimonas lutea]